MLWIERLNRATDERHDVADLNERIAVLKVEAALHGDWPQVELCRLALISPDDIDEGSLSTPEERHAARSKCIEALAWHVAGDAMLDDDGSAAGCTACGREWADAVAGDPCWRAHQEMLAHFDAVVRGEFAKRPGPG